MDRDKPYQWKFTQLCGFCSAFGDDYVLPDVLGELTIKTNEVCCLDENTTIVDPVNQTVTGDLRPRGTVKVNGDESSIFFSSLVNKMLKIIFPYSYVHSFTPSQMHEHFQKIYSQLRDAGALPGRNQENLRSGSQDFSQFDRGLH